MHYFGIFTAAFLALYVGGSANFRENKCGMTSSRLRVAERGKYSTHWFSFFFFCFANSGLVITYLAFPKNGESYSTLGPENKKHFTIPAKRGEIERYLSHRRETSKQAEWVTDGPGRERKIDESVSRLPKHEWIINSFSKGFHRLSLIYSTVVLNLCMILFYQ